MNEHQNVLYATKLFGAGDYLIGLEIGMFDFRNFMDLFNLNFKDVVQYYETITVYDEVKFGFNPRFF